MRDYCCLHERVQRRIISLEPFLIGWSAQVGRFFLAGSFVRANDDKLLRTNHNMGL